jgi:hypothetical protein
MRNERVTHYELAHAVKYLSKQNVDGFNRITRPSVRLTVVILTKGPKNSYANRISVLQRLAPQTGSGGFYVTSGS